MKTGKGSLRWARECFGIDLHGTGPATVVHAERSGKRVTCKVLGSDDKVLREGVARGVPVVGALAARGSITRWIEAPFASLRKAQRVFATLLDIQLPFALDDCVCAFLDPGVTPSGQTRALALAARKQDLQKRIDQYAETGVDPSALDQEGVALWTQCLRECPPQTHPDNSLRVLLHLASDHATLVIGQGSELCSVHAMAEADPAQVMRLLKSRQTAAEEGAAWFWSGPTAAHSTLPASLRAALPPHADASMTTVDDPATFLARGLATRALLDGPLRINFRTGAFTHAAVLARARGRRVGAAWIMLVCGALLCSANVIASMAARQADAARRTAFATAVDHVAGYHVTAKGADALKMADAEVTRRLRALQPFVAMFADTQSAVLRMVLRAGQEDGLRYDLVTLDDKSVQINGTGPAWDSGQPLLDKLLQRGLKVKLTRQGALADGNVPFTISAE